MSALSMIFSNTKAESASSLNTGAELGSSEIAMAGMSAGGVITWLGLLGAVVAAGCWRAYHSKGGRALRKRQL